MKYYRSVYIVQTCGLGILDLWGSSKGGNPISRALQSGLKRNLKMVPSSPLHDDFVQPLGHEPGCVGIANSISSRAHGGHGLSSVGRRSTDTCVRLSQSTDICVREWKYAEGIVRKHGRDQNLTTTSSTINNRRSERWEGKRGGRERGVGGYCLCLSQLCYFQDFEILSDESKKIQFSRNLLKPFISPLPPSWKSKVVIIMTQAAEWLLLQECQQNITYWPPLFKGRPVSPFQ